MVSLRRILKYIRRHGHATRIPYLACVICHSIYECYFTARSRIIRYVNEFKASKAHRNCNKRPPEKKSKNINIIITRNNS